MKVKEMHNWYQTCRIHSHLIPYVIGNEQYDGLYFSKQIYGLFIYKFCNVISNFVLQVALLGLIGVWEKKIEPIKKRKRN